MKMRTILRWFESYREIERRVEVLTREVEIVRGELIVERELSRKTAAELTDTLKRTADAMARQATGRSVFAQVSPVEMPEGWKPAPRPVSVTDQIAQINRETLEKYRKIHQIPNLAVPQVEPEAEAG